MGQAFRLSKLNMDYTRALAWRERCDASSKEAQSPATLQGLVDEMLDFPMQLVEVGELRKRLEAGDKWLKQANETLDAPCKLRVLQDLHRESEALRFKMPEVEA